MPRITNIQDQSNTEDCIVKFIAILLDRGVSLDHSLDENASLQFHSATNHRHFECRGVVFFVLDLLCTNIKNTIAFLVVIIRVEKDYCIFVVYF